MGLDLTVTLISATENNAAVKNTETFFTESPFCSNEDMNINESHSKLSKYYRLNWSGVSIERSFSYGMLGFFSLPKASRQKLKLTLKQAQSLGNTVLLVTGVSKTKFGNRNVEELVMSDSLSKGKGNILKINNLTRKKGKIVYRSRSPKYVSHYSIYAIRNTHHFSSVLDTIVLGRWGGSNGEILFLGHGDEGSVTLSSVERRYEDEEAEDETETVDLLTTLNPDQVETFSLEVNRHISAIETLLTLDPENKTGWKYIASNNLTLLYMVKTFLNNDELELVSYFG